MKTKFFKERFTVIEWLITLSVIAIVFGVMYVIFSKQFASSRNSIRWNDVSLISDMVVNYQSEYKGEYPPNIPKKETKIGTGEGEYDLGKYLTPDYISELPADPLVEEGSNIGYTVYIKEDTKKLIVSAPLAESEEEIYVIR